MILEIEDNHLLSVTNDNIGSTQMLRDGNVCLGIAKHKNNIVSLWLKKNADIELIQKEKIIVSQIPHKMRRGDERNK